MKGIYLITNNINGNQYVGLSNNIDRRFMEHKSPKNIANKKTTLAKAFRKYNIDNFSFEILEIVNSINDLAEKEIYWIKKLKPKYNMNFGGLGNKGHKLSDETKSILRLCGKLQWENKTDEEKEKIICNFKKPAFGRKLSLETKLKLRIANLGKKQSEKSKNKRSKKNKISLLGNNNGNKKVICFRNNRLIDTFNSIKDAADFYNIHPSNITKVLKGVQKSAAGCFWKYGV